MPAIIRNLPFFNRESRVQVAGQSVTVKSDQIVVWISIAEKGLSRPDLNAPRFPALLDTGCNHNLVIAQQHLSAWAGIHPEHLQKYMPIRVNGQPASQLAANVWLHPNAPGQRDAFANRPPLLLELPLGIAVLSGDDAPCPRLPLLGLRALRWNRLRVSIDGERSSISIRTGRRSLGLR